MNRAGGSSYKNTRERLWLAKQDSKIGGKEMKYITLAERDNASTETRRALLLSDTILSVEDAVKLEFRVRK